MKTSNKILLSGLLFCFLLYTSFLLYAKSEIISIKQNYINGDGIKSERTILDKLDNYDLYLSHYNEFILDDNRTGLFVTGDQNILPYFKYDNDRGIDVYIEDTLNYKHDLPLKVIYGVQNLNTLKLTATWRSKLKVDNTLKIDSLYLDVEDSATIDLDLDVKYLKLKGYDSSKIKLRGKCDQLELSLTNYSDVHLSKMNIENLNFHLNDASKLKVGKIVNISGDLEDSAILMTPEKINKDSINRYDYSRIESPN